MRMKLELLTSAATLIFVDHICEESVNLISVRHDSNDGKENDDEHGMKMVPGSLCFLRGKKPSRHAIKNGGSGGARNQIQHFGNLRKNDVSHR